MTLQNEIICEDVDLTKYIEFPYDHKCLQIVLRESNNEVNCLLKLFENSTALKITSFKAVKYRNISAEAQKNCQIFLVFAESFNETNDIFKFNEDHPKPSIFKNLLPHLREFQQLFHKD